jgi:hypothetical protein
VRQKVKRSKNQLQILGKSYILRESNRELCIREKERMGCLQTQGERQHRSQEKNISRKRRIRKVLVGFCMIKIIRNFKSFCCHTFKKEYRR